MAVRLSVIMIESAPAAAAARRLAESIVGELIGRPGVDLALIGSLDQLTPASTDRLTLDSITGDACVLDWRPAAEIVAALQAVGFWGHRAPHAWDLERVAAAAPNVQGTSDVSRRIYAFDLNRFADAADVCQALAELRATKQVRTFSLGSPAKTPGSPAKTPGSAAKTPGSAAKSLDSPSDRPAPTQRNDSAPLDEPPPPRPVTPEVAAPLQSTSAKETPVFERNRDSASGDAAQPPTTIGRINLDDLVDQLDDYDP